MQQRAGQAVWPCPVETGEAGPGIGKERGAKAVGCEDKGRIIRHERMIPQNAPLFLCATTG
jgi:hypothetical protein